MNVLVPLSTSRTVDATVLDAVERTLTATDGDAGAVHLVYTETPGRERGETATIRALFERTAALARNRIDDATAVQTARLAPERYLATPHDHAAVLAEYAREHDIDTVVLDPSYSVDATDRRLQPIEHAFERAGLPYVHADVTARRRPSVAEVRRLSATALLAAGFYLVVGGTPNAFGLATSALAGVAAGLLFRNVTFETTPSFRRAAAVTLRGVSFVPYLLWKILTANIQISYLVLHPALPIDPHLDRIDAAVGEGVSVTGLANSLTLTPGTLTVDAERNELLVHSVTRETRLEILSGERERHVRFVFYGRDPDGVPGPLDRGDAETVSGPTDAMEYRTMDDAESPRSDPAERSQGRTEDYRDE